MKIKYVVERVSDLLRANQRGGFSTSEEINRDIESAQSLLIGYYTEVLMKDRRNSNSLRPFMRTVISGGSDILVPSEFIFDVDGYAIIVDNSCGLSEDRQHTVQLGKIDNIGNITASATRKPVIDIKNPSSSNVYYSIGNGKITFYPSKGAAEYGVRYISKPTGKYATSINTVLDREDFDPNNSIDISWYPEDVERIIDIILLYKGIALNNNEVTRWVSQKTPIAKTNSQ
jgi:hypothetical protein